MDPDHFYFKGYFISEHYIDAYGDNEVEMCAKKSEIDEIMPIIKTIKPLRPE
jgi:hypothetical protein